MPFIGPSGKALMSATTSAGVLTALGLTLPGTAFTQTYSTAAATNPAVTTNTITDSSAGTPSTSAIAALADGTTYATDVAAIRNNFATLAAELALTKADLLATKKLCNSLIDVLQAAGIAS